MAVCQVCAGNPFRRNGWNLFDMEEAIKPFGVLGCSSNLKISRLPRAMEQ
jgi:hypothetical protein